MLNRKLSKINMQYELAETEITAYEVVRVVDLLKRWQELLKFTRLTHECFKPPEWDLLDHLSQWEPPWHVSALKQYSSNYMCMNYIPKSKKTVSVTTLVVLNITRVWSVIWNVKWHNRKTNLSKILNLGPLVWPSGFVYILPEIQNKICPEMSESLIHICCKGSNSVDSSIISLLNK